MKKITAITEIALNPGCFEIYDYTLFFYTIYFREKNLLDLPIYTLPHHYFIT